MRLPNIPVILRDLWHLSDERELDLIAAGIAFYGFLALFPAAAAVIAIWGFFADATLIRQELLLAKDYLPEDAYILISDQIESLLALQSDSLGLATFISLFLALWTARASIAALMRGLNAIHGLPNRASHWHHLRAILLTFVLVGLAIAALMAAVVGPLILNFFPLGAFATIALEVVQLLISLMIVVIGVALVYRLGLNRQIRHPLFTRGILVAVVIWVAASRGLVVYLANFDTYNRVYGSIGAVAALLVWLYLSGYAILLGAAVDASRARRRAEGLLQ
ncbi:YihY/virulence factor BrkB family protein [Rhodobacteraceae bacterium HSP-20]|uniref:YihY/virulence factor BrkB family protein n=1 Tax=Paragemmobacter amnigenus TaxID=2852097 RepID=A0ABS6J3F5_9RHOB|nr:YihY/virulence factor BrkB family protein [Rhodobacter amnigenus]MBU9698300.1 YihY/virulence factor BrkB family protein [Rhodobacter amnigenus]MBV4389527.1 YihY/virulence factor BrkB family protein [Rhodobacter amnigenus]